MFEVRQSEEYSRWFRNLRDLAARSRILVRIRRLSLGNLGDVKSVGQGVSELRIDFGPGYRIYFKKQGKLLVMLLVGGTKKSQTTDIAKAKALAKEFTDGA